MPVFHTKIIESILEPVAQQVSRLVILHEEAEDGNAMPDLARPVQAVSLAVNNLVKVGHETIESSEDILLKQDMPSALQRVETAASLLQQASDMLRSDPYSGPARKKLIEGSRGILQGTSALLLCFDESEVRKIVKECKRVLEYLGVAEVIDTMEDLVQFLRDMSPALSRAARQVASRSTELTHTPHANVLTDCLERVKQLAPVLICAIKIYIHILSEGGKGIDEASENRNYLVYRMADEIHEIIRVLQLTSYEEDGGERDNIVVLKALQGQMDSKLHAARQFANDPNSLRNSVGERAARAVTSAAAKAADRIHPAQAHILRQKARAGTANIDILCDERDYGRGRDARALTASDDLNRDLTEMSTIVNEGVKTAEHHAGNTLHGRLETAHKWLLHPVSDVNTRNEGQKAIRSIVAQGQRMADALLGREKAEVLGLCSEVQQLSDRLADLCLKGMGDSDQARNYTRQLMDKLHELKHVLERAVVNRVVEDFIDVAAPLRQFTEAVNTSEGTANREENFYEKANKLEQFSKQANKTAQMVALGAVGANKRLADQLINNSQQVEKLSPQVIAAGKIRLYNPYSKVAEEHFNNLRNQYSDAVLHVRDLCDQALNPLEFVQAAGELMQKHTYQCEEAIRHSDPQKIVDNTSAIARLANRVLLVCGWERENTDDAEWSGALASAHAALQRAIPHVVRAARDVATGQINGQHDWTNANQEILRCTRAVESALREREGAPPPRPPPPVMSAPPTVPAPPRPPPPAETDDEEEAIFKRQPHPSQPIMVAAHNLHRAVSEWSSKDNEIIAAAKKMAVLMARLSELVRSDSKGSKRELISTAKAIAEASEEVTKLAKKLALECTDKRIRTNLLQVCERIPTIGTQLKILSTVKATMLGAQGSEEDQEATEMLVGNAQNLMQSQQKEIERAMCCEHLGGVEFRNPASQARALGSNPRRYQ